MSGIRCQLCDGIVMNGRCKICGMLYRKDEILYHLNESSHDHYKHATPKAREMMRESRVPLGDKGLSGNRSIQNKHTYNKNVRTVNNPGNKSGSNMSKDGRLMSKEQIRAQQEKIRQEAMAKINSTKVPEKHSVTKPKNSKKGLGAFWWILIVFYIIFGVISKNL